MLAAEAERPRSAGGATSSARYGGLRPRRTRALFIGAALVVFGMVAVVPWMIWDARRLAWDRAVQSSENLTTTLAQDIERNTETYDLSLQAVILGLRLPETRSTSAEARNQILFDRAATATHFGSVLVLDETGQAVI